MKDLDPKRHDHEHLVNEVNSLRQIFQHARDLVLPKPIITKAVQNYVANTLQLTKSDIEKMVEQRIEKLITGWLFEHVKRSWLDKLISEVLRRELAKLVLTRLTRFDVKIEPVITVTEVKP